MLSHNFYSTAYEENKNKFTIVCNNKSVGLITEQTFQEYSTLCPKLHSFICSLV